MAVFRFIAGWYNPARRRRGLGWLWRLHGPDEVAGASAPFREHLECDGKRHVDRMHPFGRRDVERSGHWRRHGRHQHSIGTVLQFLDNQSRNQCLFDPGERRRKAWFVRLTGDASGEPRSSV
jgi:hypothetical protein